MELESHKENISFLIMAAVALCDEDQPYPPYSKAVHYIFITIYVFYIPMIIISNIFIIAAIQLVTNLHSPHAYILRAMAIMDLLSAVISLPVVIATEVPGSRCWLQDHNGFCYNMWFLYNGLDKNRISFLTYLCLDRFLAIVFSSVYRDYLENESTYYVHLPLFGIVLVHAITDVLLLGLHYIKGEPCLGRQDSLFTQSIAELAISLILSSLFCIPVCRVSVQHTESENTCINKRRSARLTVALLVMFISLYTPTLVNDGLVLADHSKMKNPTFIPLMRNLSLLIKYLIPITTVFVIGFTVPMYKRTFIYFLKHYPLHWPTVRRRMALAHQRGHTQFLSKFICPSVRFEKSSSIVSSEKEPSEKPKSPRSSVPFSMENKRSSINSSTSTKHTDMKDSSSSNCV